MQPDVEEALNNKLDHLRHSRGPGKREARMIYQRLLDSTSGNVHATNMYIYNGLGTGSGSEYLLGHRDRDLGSRWEVFSKGRFPFYYRMAERRWVAWPVGFGIMVARSGLYLLDIVKDVRFMLLLVPLLPHSLPIMTIAAASLVTSELFKMLYLASLPGTTVAVRLLRALGGVVIPMLMHQEEFILNIQFRGLASLPERTREQEQKLTRIRHGLQGGNSISFISFLSKILPNSWMKNTMKSVLLLLVYSLGLGDFFGRLGLTHSSPKQPVWRCRLL